MMRHIQLPDEANHIIERLTAQGFKAYAVGGCVRDFVMGSAPSDYDITTDALPHQITGIFDDAKVIETGIKHGTVTVILNGFTAEITTFRIDGSYTDSRHPDKVMFCPDLKEDLKRRDFTMNALAYNEDEGFMDFFGGINDINSGIIRCVGEPEQRFTEDALRILRALRFSAVLGFDIEKSTAEAVNAKYTLLSNISVERIFEELKKLLNGKRAYNVLTSFKNVFCFLLPELNCLTAQDYNDTALLVSRLPGALRLTALFYHCNAESARTALRRLKSDNRTVYDVCTALEVCSQSLTPERSHILNLMKNYDLHPVLDALMLISSVVNPSPMVKDIKNVIADILKSNQCYKISQLAVNGSDLIEIGITDGKQIGAVLDTLLNEVMKGSTANTKEQLLITAKNLNPRR